MAVRQVVFFKNGKIARTRNWISYLAIRLFSLIQILDALIKAFLANN